MSNRPATTALFLCFLAAIMSGCSNSAQESYELTYIVTGGTSTLVDPGKLVYDVNAISVSQDGEDPTQIEGNLLRLRMRRLTEGGRVVQTRLEFAYRNNENELIAVARLLDADESPGFESVYASGDLSMMPETQLLSDAIASIDDFGEDRMKLLEARGRLEAAGADR